MHYCCRIDGDTLKINMRSETQAEAYLIMEACRAAKKPVESYGGVNQNETWAWFFIPLKKYRSNIFNNDD